MTIKKEKTLINFKKAQSLISKIIKMVEADEYCIDIMQQNAAVIGLLKSAHQMLMENHLNTCFQKAMETKRAWNSSCGFNSLSAMGSRWNNSRS